MSGIPLIVNPQPLPRGPESFEQKAKRKFKEQPLVPIGVGLTCCALVYSFIRQRQGRSRDMNKWLWARIGFQGLTVAAMVGGSFALGTTTQQLEARRQTMEADANDERAGFEARMRAAEEAHAEETRGPPTRERRGPPGREQLGRAKMVDVTAVPDGVEPAGVQMAAETAGTKSWWPWKS